MRKVYIIKLFGDGNLQGPVCNNSLRKIFSSAALTSCYLDQQLDVFIGLYFLISCAVYKLVYSSSNARNLSEKISPPVFVL